jgi:hypothetical protein
VTRVFVVWDESHLWGLLVLRALRSLGVSHRILRANDIAEGALSGKSALVIAPGGWARGKALRLGPAGMAALRDFVAAGGNYLGFCGGAGLALTSPRPQGADESLGLCPWGRMGFAGRLQHFLSGHTRLALAPNQPLGLPCAHALLAPVWWPAQFAPPAADDPSVTVLARYAGLADDFWVADLPLSRIPAETLGDWENLYGVQIRPDFLFGRPAVISGSFGRGRYVLSYPHLETPDSPEANLWLSHLLRELADAPCSPGDTLPLWDLPRQSAAWDDPALASARSSLEAIIRLGQDHMLLFWRNPWLLGWRRGIPGPGINSLLALVCEAQSSAPGDAALIWWRERSEEFARLATLFCDGLAGLLLAERLDMTVRATDSEQAFTSSLRETRRALFGTPPATGGLCGELMGTLEELCARAWE